MHTTGSGEPSEPPPINHCKPSVLLSPALPWRIRGHWQVTQELCYWSHSVHPVTERPRSYAWHSRKVLKNLGFRSQNNFLLQRRKLRPGASVRLTLGHTAELGSLCFARSETNSETKQGDTIKWEDSPQMDTPYPSTADLGLVNDSEGSLLKEKAGHQERAVALCGCVHLCVNFNQLTSHVKGEARTLFCFQVFFFFPLNFMSI